MRTVRLIFALVAIVACYGCSHLNAGTRTTSKSITVKSYAPNSSVPSSTAFNSSPGSLADSAAAATAAPARVDFSTQIKPVLQAKCQPCHFNGGKVYAQMPFDRPETIKTLGTKLFTRIKDEHERQLIRDFLAQE
jgi:uncharacterized membrane protein